MFRKGKSVEAERILKIGMGWVEEGQEWLLTDYGVFLL